MIVGDLEGRLCCTDREDGSGVLTGHRRDAYRVSFTL